MKLKMLFATVVVASVVLAGALGGWWYWRVHTTVQDAVRTLKFAVTRDFHDPDSARFRSVELQSLQIPIVERLKLIDLQILAGSKIADLLTLLTYDTEIFQLCGEVNAKNAFGAYVGYKRFYVSGGKDSSAFIDTREHDDFAKTMCGLGQAVIYSEPDVK